MSNKNRKLSSNSTSVKEKKVFHMPKISKKHIFNFLSALFLLTEPVLIFYTMEFFLRNPFEKMRGGLQFLNIVFFELFALFLFAITKSIRRAIRIEAILALLIGLLNYFVVQFRSNPIMPWDIFSIKTAASVAGNYEYSLKPHAIVCVLIFIVLIMVCQIFPTKYNFKKTPRIIGAIVSLSLLILLGKYVQTDECVSRFRIYNILFTPNTMTYKDGTVVAFLLQCQYLSVETPKSYSSEKAEVLLKTAPALAGAETGETTDTQQEIPAPNEQPNIIVIMNEAFSDLSILDEYTTNEEEIPYIKSLMSGAKDTYSGYMDVSILGGNTANTEFEFLTGDSMAFLPQGCIPYQQFVHDQTDSMATSLKEMGYRTIALHPYRAKGWDRHEVYEYFGFDHFYSESDFSDPHRYRNYISDWADVEKVIEIYEEDPDTPLFMFNVTMQNHSSYTDAYENFVPDISVEGTDSFALNQYLSLLKESDRSLEYLISYFKHKNDPTIIVFFGDHQPTNSVVSPIYKLNDRSVSSLSGDELLNRYRVPYVIHANFDIEEATDAIMSPNYLGVKTLELANLPLTDYQQFLANQYKQYPSISVMQVTDANGNTSSITDNMDLLNDYQILQYYHLFNK